MSVTGAAYGNGPAALHVVTACARDGVTLRSCLGSVQWAIRTRNRLFAMSSMLR